MGAHATYAAACARIMRDSGMPIRSTDSAAAFATTKAIGSAFDTSSAAQMVIRLAMNFMSSPAASIRAK